MAVVELVTGTNAARVATQVRDLTDAGWELVGPVQVACGTDSDGGWNVTFAATLTKAASSSKPGVERDILDQDPMLDDTVTTPVIVDLIVDPEAS